MCVLDCGWVMITNQLLYQLSYKGMCFFKQLMFYILKISSSTFFYLKKLSKNNKFYKNYTEDSRIDWTASEDNKFSALYKEKVREFPLK